jgi:hypothetical protein
MTTQKTVTWASWRWANPLWWAERQLEATRFAVHVTAAMFDASLSSVYSPLPRVRLEASTYSAPAPQAAAAVTAVTAVVTVARPERQLEAAEPLRELQPAVPETDLDSVTAQADLEPVTAQADLEPVTSQADLEPVTSQGDLEPVTPQADLGLVTAGADLEAVILDAEPATAGPGPDVTTAEPSAVPEPGPGPQAPAAEAVREADTVPSAPVPGWDELTLGSIRARLRRLSEDDLTALQSYEKAHGARPDVLSMLENRLVKIRSTQSES